MLRNGRRPDSSLGSFNMRRWWSIPWYLTLPLLCMALEGFLQGGYPFSVRGVSLILDKTKGGYLEILVTLLSIYATYVFLAVCLDILLSGRSWWASLFFWVLFFVSWFEVNRVHPYFKGHFLLQSTPLFITAATVSLLFHYNFSGISNRVMQRVTLVFAGSFLLLGQTTDWERGSEGSSVNIPKVGLPSFVLLGVDGVPADYFFLKEENRWKEKATSYSRAYSTSNSTYTSWASILSGLHPIHNGIESLYPRDRTGHVLSDQWLPRRLEKLGYSTVFMTDCGTTSSMTDAVGFQERYQMAKGAMGCLKASVHSSFLMSRFPSKLFPSFFSEGNSFCSAHYSPNFFFAEVERTLTRLSQSWKPYFLAIHSCVTHRDIYPHVPPMDSVLRQSLPQQASGFSKAERDLLYSIRWWEESVNAVLNRMDGFIEKPATFIFSDHGVRVDRTGKETHLSHGFGLPVQRYQYHVPLLVIHAPSPFGDDLKAPLTLDAIYSGVIGMASGKSEERRKSNPIFLSSLPVLETEQFWGWMQNSHIDTEGMLRFSRTAEEEMAGMRSVAILLEGHRIVFSPGAQPLVYDEDRDPVSEKDLYWGQTGLVERARDQICGFSSKLCPGPILNAASN